MRIKIDGCPRNLEVQFCGYFLGSKEESGSSNNIASALSTELDRTDLDVSLGLNILIGRKKYWNDVEETSGVQEGLY